MTDALVATVEGPRGKAELYEITSTDPDGVLAITYEVRQGAEVHRFSALGAAYIAAGELTGAKT